MPLALRLRAYISGKSLMPMLQLVHVWIYQGHREGDFQWIMEAPEFLVTVLKLLYNRS